MVESITGLGLGVGVGVGSDTTGLGKLVGRVGLEGRDTGSAAMVLVLVALADLVSLFSLPWPSPGLSAGMALREAACSFGVAAAGQPGGSGVAPLRGDASRRVVVGVPGAEPLSEEADEAVGEEAAEPLSEAHCCGRRDANSIGMRLSPGVFDMVLAFQSSFFIHFFPLKSLSSASGKARSNIQQTLTNRCALQPLPGSRIPSKQNTVVPTAAPGRSFLD